MVQDYEGRRVHSYDRDLEGVKFGLCGKVMGKADAPSAGLPPNRRHLRFVRRGVVKY
jgi:hypothetical protein